MAAMLHVVGIDELDDQPDQSEEIGGAEIVVLSEEEFRLFLAGVANDDLPTAA